MTFRLWKRKRKRNIIDMMMRGEKASFKTPLTDDEKSMLVKTCSDIVITPLMWLFYTCEMKTGIEASCVNLDDGVEFKMSFLKTDSNTLAIPVWLHEELLKYFENKSNVVEIKLQSDLKKYKK